MPELAQHHSFAATAVISGPIWALWHYPVFLLARGYSPSTPVRYYLPFFTLLLPVISFVWTWMRLKTGSLWPGVVLHAAHNTFIQLFFDPLTVYNSRTRYVARGFGVAAWRDGNRVGGLFLEATRCSYSTHRRYEGRSVRIT